MDAKDSCFIIEADKIVLKTDSGVYTIRINKDGSVSTTLKKNGVIISDVSRSGKDGINIELDKSKDGSFEKLWEKEGSNKKVRREINVEEEEMVIENIIRLRGLIDSVFYFGLNSKSKLDSIYILYNLTENYMRTEGMGRFVEIFSNMEIIRGMVWGQVYHQYIDKSTGDTIIEIMSPSTGEIIERNVKKKVMHLPLGEDRWTEEVIGDRFGMSRSFDANKNELILDGPKSHQYKVGANTILLENSGGDKAFIGNLNTSSNDFVGFEMDPTSKTITGVSGGTTTLLVDSLRVLVEALMQSLKVQGNGFVQGNFHVNGNLSKNAGSFRIDHPDDPTNKYLYHSFVESPDMMNVYNGNATTDSMGYDTIVLPEYFKSLNRDFRYQLTCIGTFAQAIVLQEIENNQFVIQTDKPNVKVSWQVTGIRKDNYAEDNRIEVEVEKEEAVKGTLQYIPKTTNP